MKVFEQNHQIKKSSPSTIIPLQRPSKQQQQQSPLNDYKQIIIKAQMLYRWLILLLIFFLSLPPLGVSWCRETYLKTNKQIRTMATSLGGRYLAVAHNDMFVRIYNANSYTKAGEYFVGFLINVIRFSNDGYYLAIAGGSSSVIIINAYEPFAYNTTVNPNVGTFVVGIDFGSASAMKFLACGGNSNSSGKINLMNIVHTNPWANAIIKPLNANPNSTNPNDCRISPFDGRIIVSTDLKLQLYDPTLTTNVMTWTANGGTAFSKLIFNPLAASILFIDSNSNLTYSLSLSHSNNTPVALSSFTTSIFTALDFSYTGKYMATGGNGKILYIYDSTRTAVARWDTSAPIRSIAFSKNNPNQRLYVGDASGQILVLSFNCSSIICSQDYYLDYTGCKFCGDAIPKCIICSNQTICEKCVDRYFVNPNTFKCDACNLFGCLICSSANNCSECHSGFYSVTINNLTTCKRCSQSIEGCAICNSSDTCIACNNDYFLDTVTTPFTPKCKICTTIPNCVKCFNDTVCIQCVTGYFKNGNTCDACHVNCLACDGSATNCTQCARGWYVATPNFFTCTRCVTGCLSCNNSNFCFECQNGMYQKTDGTCATCVFPCTQCEDNSVCNACAGGYFLSGTSCSPCINNCATCNSTTYCATCVAGYYTSTDNLCKGCGQNYLFCEYCNSSVCQSCQLGYFLNSSSLCQPCGQKMFKCQKCSSDTECLSCIEGFYLTRLTGNSSCKSCEVGCQTCVDSGDCRKCFKPYYLDVNMDCVPCAGNCLMCKDASTCEVCDMGYFLDGIVCKRCGQNITNCLTCLNGVICIDCEMGYFLDLNDNKCKKCTANCLTCDQAKCISCSLGFYLTSSTNPTCQPCSQACTECTATFCTSCKVGYYLDYGICKNCTTNKHCLTCNISTCFSCHYGYFLDNTISPPNFSCTWCEVKIQGCLQCNASNNCTACDYGYFLDTGSNLCRSCVTLSGCQKCSNSLTCEICSSGFFLNSSNQCQPCRHECSTCDSSGTCLSCSAGFYLNGPNCVVCKTNIEGCSLCSTPTTCLQCMNGYFLQHSISQCNLCRKSLVGCLYCNGSSVCTNCQSGFYLNTTSKRCETCHKNMAGCQVCSAYNVCMDCWVGYYLTNGGGSGCTLCSASLAGCMACSDINTCLRCKTGFYLTNGKCQTCLTVNSGCQSCSRHAVNGIMCSQCSSGFSLDLTTNLCIPCVNLGCQICDQTNPSVCITCESIYFKSGNNCQKCKSVLQGCSECSSGMQCNMCDIGYYLEAGKCKLCQDLIGGCRKCGMNGSGMIECIECMSSFILDPVSKSCAACSSVMEGCTYCLNKTACVSCSNGYFKDSVTSLCRSCTEQQGCVLCSNEVTCDYCAASYFMDYSLSKCIKCSSLIEDCVTCLQATRCLSCEIGYFVNEKHKCQQITVKATNKPEGVKLITEFVDWETLSHTLMVANDRYSNVGYDLTGACSLYLTDYNQVSTQKKVHQIKLVIKDIKWISATKIRFLTDNPTNLHADKMGLERRLLSQSFDLNLKNFKVSLQMNQQAINAILPNVYQTGDLVLDSSLNEPQFYTSYLKAQSSGSAPYSYFGVIISVVLILNFAFKTYKLQRDQNMHHHTGEIMSHVFALKTTFLFHYPITHDFYYFCYGFMTVDLPWANHQIGSVFGQQADEIPQNLAMYFYNLNIASTYLLALCVGVGLFCLRFFINESKELARAKYTQLIYVIFMFGMTFAGSLSVQGAKLNPIQKLTVNSLFYLIGIILYLAIFIQMLYSVYQKKENFYRVRIFLKATFLSICHFNPIIMVSISIILDILLVCLQFIVVENGVAWKKIWLVNHLLLDIVLALIFLLPHSLLSLYGSMTIISVITFIQILLNFKLMSYCEERAKVKRAKEDKPKSPIEQTKVGFIMNESLETFIDEKDYNKFDIWNVEYAEYAGGEIGTLNEIALQEERVQKVKKQFQENVETKYYSFGKGYRPRAQQTQESINANFDQQYEKQYERQYQRQINRRQDGRQQRKKLTSKEIEDRKKQLNPFRIESSSSSPTDESAKSEEEKKKPKDQSIKTKNRQMKKIRLLS